MQRLCDKYNRAIDSIHQLVSLCTVCLYVFFCGEYENKQHLTEIVGLLQ